MVKKWVYSFGKGKADGHAGMKGQLGGKGANLAEMSRLGIPVPPGFTLAAEICSYRHEKKKDPPGLWKEVDRALARLERAMGFRFGDPERPLLVSVRSGAAVSMPGMMDTILNLGLNAKTAEGLARWTGNPRFAADARRRFIQMYANVVDGVPGERFERIIEEARARAGVESDPELSAGQLEEVVRKFLALYKKEKKRPFPEDPRRQLRGAIEAVFRSWDNPRAVTYRRLNKITGLLGTGVNVQAMVFGNLGETSGTGVCFTRDPSTGAKRFYGEYLVNAQGEDVVAGIRTPEPIDTMRRRMPKGYARLVRIKDRLELHYREMQDIEFTVQEGKLFILQTRTGKRTAAASIRIATDLVAERWISKGEALARLDLEKIEALLHPTFDPKAERTVLAKGLPASPGGAVGQAALSAHEAETRAAEGQPVILVRPETSPEDIAGMAASVGILTARGGKTSHAAVVARGMGTCCVVGCGAIRFARDGRSFEANGTTIRSGDWISLDGSSGELMAGRLPTVEAKMDARFRKMLRWADEVRRLGVWANADTPEDAARGRELGAEGIGLCRTEHMFFGPDRIAAVRQMILASDTAGREAALKKLLPFQRKDFVGIFRGMTGLPVTIRLLDPPLHEFLPFEPAAQREMAKLLGVSVQIVHAKVEQLREANPMLGHRGCRLGVTYPEVYRMQTRAILEAAVQVRAEGKRPVPYIMVPLVSVPEEFRQVRETIDAEAAAVFKRKGRRVPYKVGTMIEVPRAALVADRIAEEAEFFSFGTNDLTQMTYGFSRDDIGPFLGAYLEEGILPGDPFASLDVAGVGRLVEEGVRRGRGVKPDLKIGICGEHGGDPASIGFCHRIGLDTVSCSPFRVPVARLAAAQAALAADGPATKGRPPRRKRR